MISDTERQLLFHIRDFLFTFYYDIKSPYEVTGAPNKITDQTPRLSVHCPLTTVHLFPQSGNQSLCAFSASIAMTSASAARASSESKTSIEYVSVQFQSSFEITALQSPAESKIE